MLHLDHNEVRRLTSQLGLHLDAAQGIFFTRELEEIDAKMYDVKYANLEVFELVPVKSDINPGAETYTFRSGDSRGVAVVTANYADTAPRADVSATEETSKLRSIRAAYGYNVQELRAAAMHGRPLDSMRAEAARRAINEKLNEIGLKGDAAHNLVGLFNQSSTVTTTPSTKTGGGTSWDGATATADEILGDMYAMVDAVPQATQRIHKVTRIALPYGKLDKISAKRLGAGDGGVTILETFRRNRPGVQVRGALGLETAGSGAGTRAISYEPTPENLQFLVPVAFESFPPQVKGMEFTVDVHARCGSVILRYPKSMCYTDAI